MARLSVHEDCTCFFKELAAAQRRVLLVDYDTVIHPLAEAHSAGLPYPTVIELLDCIMTAGRTQVVLLTHGSNDLAPSPGVRAESTTAGLGWAGPHPEVWQQKDFKAEPACVAWGPHLDPRITAVLQHAGERTALAYLSEKNAIYAALQDEGEGQSGAVAFQPGDDLAQGVTQFLVDWLRVCGGEIC